MDKEINLIKIYFYVSEDKDVQYHLKGLRMSNNYQPRFTDEEVLTICLYSTLGQKYNVKNSYLFAKDYLKSWFPGLPSYQAFNNRLNKLHSTFEVLVKSINLKGLDGLVFPHEKVLDSVPIIVAGNRRSSSAKVAPQLCSKGYCSSKDMYYYGLKLHFCGIVRPSKIPAPQACWISGAEENDLTEARGFLETLRDCKVYADKIYADKELEDRLRSKQNVQLLTPVKKKKGERSVNAADAIYSSMVSRVRQPVESFFNWLIEKSNIQTAQRVRSENGLRVHVWSKYAAALLILTEIINP